MWVGLALGGKFTRAAMERLWGCHFAVAVFTNLTRDDIDYKQVRKLFPQPRGDYLKARHRRS